MNSKLTEAQITINSQTSSPQSLRIDRERSDHGRASHGRPRRESLDLIEITMETESAFDVWLPEKSILDTAAEIFGPDVLVQEGLLTEAGKEMLRRRMPPETRTCSKARLRSKLCNPTSSTVGAGWRMIDRLWNIRRHLRLVRRGRSKPRQAFACSARYVTRKCRFGLGKNSIAMGSSSITTRNLCLPNRGHSRRADGHCVCLNVRVNEPSAMTAQRSFTSLFPMFRDGPIRAQLSRPRVPAQPVS